MLCSQQIININSQISSWFQQLLNYLYNLPVAQQQLRIYKQKHFMGEDSVEHVLEQTPPGSQSTQQWRKLLWEKIFNALILHAKSKLVLKHCGHVLCNRIPFSGFHVLILHVLTEQKLGCTLLLICAFHELAWCLAKAETHNQPCWQTELRFLIFIFSAAVSLNWGNNDICIRF